jgi:hypothetical protein
MALMPELPTPYTLKDPCMSSTRIPDSAPFKGAPSAQLERIEAELARIVGAQGSQALLARSRHLCGQRGQSAPTLQRTLLQLVRKLLGKPLAQWLQQSSAPLTRARATPLRLR